MPTSSHGQQGHPAVEKDMQKSVQDWISDLLYLHLYLSISIYNPYLKVLMEACTQTAFFRQVTPINQCCHSPGRVVPEPKEAVNGEDAFRLTKLPQSKASFPGHGNSSTNPLGVTVTQRRGRGRAGTGTRGAAGGGGQSPAVAARSPAPRGCVQGAFVRGRTDSPRLSCPSY